MLTRSKKIGIVFYVLFFIGLIWGVYYYFSYPEYVLGMWIFAPFILGSLPLYGYILLEEMLYIIAKSFFEEEHTG